MNVFNMLRDNLYLKENVKLVLLVNQLEYSIFLSEWCDDFTSYATYRCDIDNLLGKDKDIQTMDER